MIRVLARVLVRPLLLVALMGCASPSAVVRLVDGRTVRGPFVSDVAYAEALDASLAAPLPPEAKGAVDAPYDARTCLAVLRHPREVRERAALFLAEQGKEELAWALAGCVVDRLSDPRIRGLALDGAFYTEDLTRAWALSSSTHAPVEEVLLRGYRILGPSRSATLFARYAELFGMQERVLAVEAALRGEHCSAPSSMFLGVVCGDPQRPRGLAHDRALVHYEVLSVLRGKLQASEVSSDAQVEVSLRRNEPFQGVVVDLDARHRWAFGLGEPSDASQHYQGRDPLRALVALRHATPVQNVLRHHPSDPLILTWCVRNGQCRERAPMLHAVALTPFEQATAMDYLLSR